MKSLRYVTNFLSSRAGLLATSAKECKYSQIIATRTNFQEGFISSYKPLSAYQMVEPLVNQERFYRIGKFTSNTNGAPYSQKKETKEEKSVPNSEILSNSQHNSSQHDHSKATPPVNTKDSSEPEQEGILLRFKNTYKRHGKICLAVHLATSSVWAGSFYCLAVSGIDIVVILQKLGVAQVIIDKVSSPSVGHIATAYLLYKLASPLRYMVTIAGTGWVVKYLQRIGKMPATPEENKITSLLKEGGVNIPKPRRRRTKSPKP